MHTKWLQDAGQAMGGNLRKSRPGQIRRREQAGMGRDEPMEGASGGPRGRGASHNRRGCIECDCGDRQRARCPLQTVLAHHCFQSWCFSVPCIPPTTAHISSKPPEDLSTQQQGPRGLSPDWLRRRGIPFDCSMLLQRPESRVHSTTT